MTRRDGSRPDSKRILIVDEQPIVRKGLRKVIESQSDLMVCAESDGVASALSAVDEHEPDLAVADLNLRGDAGVELVESLRARAPRLPILVLGVDEDPLDAERALRAGAQGYLAKSEAGDDLLKAIRTLFDDGIFVSPRLTPGLLRRLLSGSLCYERVPIEKLSNRELQVFGMIGEGLSCREIADSLNLSVKTIETHRAHVKEKLQLADARQLMQQAVRWVLTRRA